MVSCLLPCGEGLLRRRACTKGDKVGEGAQKEGRLSSPRRPRLPKEKVGEGEGNTPKDRKDPKREGEEKF